MKELLLELLTYEPFGKFLSEEKTYIHDILSGNYHQPQSKFHDLFTGFYYYIQRGNLQDIGWLRGWKDKYHQNKNYMRYTLLFKKICFYIIVKWKIVDEKFTDKKFMAMLNLDINLIWKWDISTEFRKYAEADTYSTISSFRHGVKKKYIVSTVKKLYYEAGRQQNKSVTLNKLPPFIDLCAGTATVIASVISDGCPPPIANDADPLMICFIWAFTYYQKELRSRLAEFQNSVMREDFNSIKLSYTEGEYENHYGFMDSLIRLKPGEYWEDKSERFWRKERLTNEHYWENPWIIRVKGYSKSQIAEGKKKARCHKEFIIRMRSWYVSVKKYLDSLDKNALRTIDFNALPKTKNMIKDQDEAKQVDDILDYALALFYYYSFKPLGKNVFHVTCVDERNYYSFLDRLSVNLEAVKGMDRADRAKALSKLRLYPNSIDLEYIGNFSKNLRDAKFYSKDFRDLLQVPEVPSNGIYYWDSPYFLTTGYDVQFSDEDHKDMLEILRGAKFKWIFSMQYKKSTTGKDRSERKKQSYIIKDYGAYYRGFYARLHLDADQRFYIAAGTPQKAPSKLFVILFDSDAAKKKKQKVYRKTKEMLVLNFNPLRTIPLHDTAVVYPFNLFLKCADAGMEYPEIVQRAIAWRKGNITRKYAGQYPV